MTSDQYSDEQVEAALDAYHRDDGRSWRAASPYNLRSYRDDMRSALAAASVPVQSAESPELTRSDRKLAWVIVDFVREMPKEKAISRLTGLLARVRAESVAAARLVLPPAEPQPDAPTDISALPDYWDERRRLQQKPDLSRCAAELRIALAWQAKYVALMERERAPVDVLAEEIAMDAIQRHQDGQRERARELRDAIRGQGLWELQRSKALDELVRLAGGGE